jgi:hypothetical protein
MAFPGFPRIATLRKNDKVNGDRGAFGRPQKHVTAL